MYSPHPSASPQLTYINIYIYFLFFRPTEPSDLHVCIQFIRPSLIYYSRPAPNNIVCLHPLPPPQKQMSRTYKVLCLQHQQNIRNLYLSCPIYISKTKIFCVYNLLCSFQTKCKQGIVDPMLSIWGQQLIVHEDTNQ